MRKVLIFSAFFLIQGCVTAPENNLFCVYEEVKPTATTSTRQVILAARSVSEVKAQFVNGRLSADDQIKLDSANTKEQLQSLIMELMTQTNSPEHEYVFAGPDNCALKKIYSGKYSETVCIQSGGAKHGFNGGNLVDNLRFGEEAIRKDITSWSLALGCEGTRCAVTSQGGYKDNYFFLASFKDESKSLLAVKALNKYGDFCSSRISPAVHEED